MIGKETDAQIIIGKALVEGLIDGGEGNVCLFGKNIFQALILFLTICKDINLIALQEVIFERLGEQVEVLMEERLNGDMKVDSCVIGR